MLDLSHKIQRKLKYKSKCIARPVSSNRKIKMKMKRMGGIEKEKREAKRPRQYLERVQRQSNASDLKLSRRTQVAASKTHLYLEIRQIDVLCNTLFALSDIIKYKQQNRCLALSIFFLSLSHVCVCYFASFHFNSTVVSIFLFHAFSSRLLSYIGQWPVLTTLSTPSSDL